MHLSTEHVKHFNDEGYVIVRNALETTDLDPVVREIEEYIGSRAEDLYAAGEISGLYSSEPFDRRLASLTSESIAIYDEMDIMHFRGEQLFRFLGNERLMELLSGFLGTEITCSPIQHLRPKLPSHLKALNSQDQEALAKRIGENVAPWHQDVQVHLEEADPAFILTVWIPLCDTDENNGCLQIVPRVHKERQVYWGAGFGVSADALPGTEVLSVPMRRGDVLLMHKLIPHRSIPNKSETIRWSMDLRYQQTGTPTGRSFYPDFVTKSAQHPESVLKEYKVWSSDWIRALEATPTDKRPGRKHRPTQPSAIEIEGL